MHLIHRSGAICILTSSFLLLLAEILFLVRAAASFVFCRLRVGKEWASADDFAIRVAFLGDEFVGGLAFFDPADDGFVESGGRGAGAAEAVIDAGREEQARELRRVLGGGLAT